MIYYYSGANKFDAVQTDPNLSLGGFISSSVVPNDLLQNIFSEASYLSIQQKKRETKLIVLQNNSSQQATALSLDFLLNDSSISTYKIAFVSPSEDNCFEQISNSSALPLNAEFDDVEAGVPVSLPDLDPEEYLGIWITRTYNYDSEDLQVKDKDYYVDQLENPTTPDLSDSLNLILDYTLV